MRVQSSSRCQVSSTRVIGRSGVPVTWCAVVNMVITPCTYARPRDEILWRHAAMAEAGSSETGGGITGALGKAAWRVVPDPMSQLHHVGYASAGRPAMLGDFSAAIPTQDGEPRH